MSDDLRLLLRRSAPAPERILTVAMLEDEGHRRRRKRNRLGGAGMALIAAAAVVTGVLTMGQGPDPAGIATISGGPGPSPVTTTESVAPNAPTLTLIPGEPPAEGSSVGVKGTGFIPNTSVVIRQCPENTDCVVFSVIRTVVADGDGAFTAAVTLRNNIILQSGNEMSCAKACFLVAQSLPESANVTATTATFDLAPPVNGVGQSCLLNQLTVTYAGGVSPMTGEHSAVINLRNSTPRTCWLNDYPNVRLVNSRGASMPFVVGLGGSYIHERPALVQLAPGDSAHFVVAKYRCDAGAGAAATSLGFLLPGGVEAAFVALPKPGSGDQLQYCQSAGESATKVGGDPGNAVQIGPFSAGAH